MKSTFGRIGALLLLLMGVGYGCGDNGNQVVPSTGPRKAELLSSTSVTVLTRNTPLNSDISASAMIGKQGGEIAIPEAGIKVVFPSNALVPPKAGSKVLVTVTALKGDEVAYTFEPHGLRFREPVQIQQDYKATQAWKNPVLLALIEGGYFSTPDAIDRQSATALVSEFRPTLIDVTGSKIKFTVDHFSGYLVVSGRNRM